MFNRMKAKSERGMVMVEAVIYFPLVIAIVSLVLYIVLFNVQEYLIMYQCQKLAAVVTRETTYPGYSEFGMGEGNGIELTEQPSGDEVVSYQKASHGSFKQLYREVPGIASALTQGSIGGINTSAYEEMTLPEDIRIITVGSIGPPEIDVEYSLFGNGISVSITHEIPVPGIIKYLGREDGTDIRTAAYGYSVNPTSFVRNVNVAWDVGTYIDKKLKLSEKAEGVYDNVFKGFLDKSNGVLGKIAGDTLGNGKFSVSTGIAAGGGVASEEQEKSYSEEEIREILAQVQGTGYKNHPLRVEYESKVKALADEAEKLRKDGLSEQDIAKKMNQMRRDLGIEYKNMTPEPLRDYIYEINRTRYGDPLGPTYEKMKEAGKTDAQIIASATRPNDNVDRLLSDFEDWLWKHKKS